MNKLDRIVETACYIGNISTKDFKSRSRERHIVDIKRMTYAIARDVLRMPYLHIAKYFKVNHATVIHHYKLNMQLVDTDTYYFKKYNTILQMVKSDLNLVEIEELMELVQRLQANKESQLELKEKLTKFYNKDENQTNTETTSIKPS
jgi:hypothetical protein|tara:strand:- start:3702 stop:4142 length:441 start_codon:yes stop_codon:yes gene_type:complete